MSIVLNPAAAWICFLAGAFACGACLVHALHRVRGASRWWQELLCGLLPAALGLLFAWAGFLLLQMDESVVSFRWCYTTGFWGAALGVTLAARLRGAGSGEILDGTAGGLCLLMAAARLAQRWLEEAGTGPLMEESTFYAMINEWEEPVFPTWLLEGILCLLAAGLVFYYGRKKRTSGCVFSLAVFLLMIPQILVEQFRSGAYLRFMMMRLEQALFALSMLSVLIFLCRKARKRGRKGFSAWMPVVLSLLFAAGIAVAQFLLDGKILEECPLWVCWSLYGAMIAGLLVNGWVALRRVDDAQNTEKR